MISIKEAIKFHGHLGPYLILGVLAGNLGLKKTGCNKYFGLEVKVYGANKKPKSCLIDGLQLSTGATYGKGNIQKYKGKNIKITIRNLNNNRRITMLIAKQIKNELDGLKGHSESERLARWLFKLNHRRIFTII